jgi:SAM-dependent methyltransferase
VQEWISDIEFERLSVGKKIAKKLLLNPLANYLPVKWWKTWLAEGQSELALANWRDPGGWRSMVISYENNPDKPWDRVLVKAGTIPMALRNRRKLAARLIARLIDACPHTPAQVLCLGAGPGMITADAMLEAEKPAEATLVDLSNDAFAFGREQAEKKGILERMHFIQGDVRDVEQMLQRPPDVVKMIGICEYLQDEQVVAIAKAISAVVQPGTAIVFNSISERHGTDRFFRRVFGLHMIHRTPEQIQDLLRPAGFTEFHAYPEPLGVYHVCLGRIASETTSEGKDS